MKYALLLAISVCCAGTEVCRPGEWNLEGVCSKCHPSCSLCTDSFGCDVCSPCYTRLAENKGICYPLQCPDWKSCVCPQGCLALPHSEICTACHSTCLQCVGPSAQNCTACGSPLQLKAGECLLVNFTNTDGDDHTCDESCRTCSGPKPQNCLTCYENFVLAGPSPSSCQCQPNMVPAYNSQSCRPCPLLCSVCDQQGVCLTCVANATLKASINPPVCVCEQGFYHNNVTALCQPCHSSCQSCTGASPLQCINCKGLKFLDGLYCASNCPFTVNGDLCTFPDEILFHLEFNSLLNSFKDLTKKYVTVPVQQPYVLFHQGLQLNGSQYLQLPPNSADSRDLVLPSSFQLEIWTRAVSGCVFSKTLEDVAILTLCLNKTWILTAQLYRTSQNISLPPNQALYNSPLRMPVQLSLSSKFTWTKLSVSLVTRATTQSFAVDITFTINNIALSKTLNNSFFRDFTTAEGQVNFSLGTYGLIYLEGAIAEFLILSGKAKIPTYSCSCELCTSAGSCLSPCLATQYLEHDRCRPCNSSCTHGCLRPLDCSQNLDPLCATYEQFDSCVGCIFLAEFKGNTCQCIENARLKQTKCVCQEGYQLSYGACVPCLTYYHSSEIYASATANSFVLTFERPLQTGLKTCTEIFSSETLALLGSQPQCRFHFSSIKVILGANFQLRQGNLTLNAQNVMAATGNCSFTSEPLQVYLQLLLPPPPVAILSLPEQFSISCGVVLVLSGANSYAGALGNLLYSWNLTTDFEDLGSSLGTFSVDHSDVKLLSSRLQPGLLYVNLTVKDIYGQEAFSIGVVQLIDQTGLSVEIEGGNQITILSEHSSEFRCRVKQGCGKPPFSYSWSTTQFKQTSNKYGILQVAPSSLRPGVHNFTCTASDSTGKLGSTSLKLSICSSPLTIRCDHIAGVISAILPLRANCSNSTDPDDPSTILTGNWTCVMNGIACKTTEGAPLYLAEGLTLYVQERTLSSGEYKFTITVRKGSREASCTLTFAVVAESGLQILSHLPPKRIPNQHPQQVVLAVNIPIQSRPTLVWSEPFSSIQPFLQLPPDLLVNGDPLELMFRVQLGSSLVNVRMELQINNPPILGMLIVEPKVGQALMTSFRMQELEALDTEGSDYPLNFAFGCTVNDTDYYLSLSQAANFFNTLLCEGVNQVFCKVCDSADSCSYAYAALSIQSSSRILQSTDLQQMFDQLATDPDQVPALCTVFALHADLDSGLWSHIFNTLKTVVQSSLNEQEVLTIFACLEALATQSSAQTQPLLSFISQVFRLYSGQLYENIFTAAVKVFSKCHPQQGEVPELLNRLDVLVRAYGNTLLPEQPPFLFSSRNLNLSGTRTLARSGIYQDTGLTLPYSFLTNTSLYNITVLDVWACRLQSPFFPAAVTSLRLRHAGSLIGLVWNNASAEDLPQNSTLFTITVPVYNLSALDGPTSCLCWKQSAWTVVDPCLFTNLSSDSITLITRCIGVFTIVPVQMETFQPDSLPEIYLTPENTEGCERLYIPLYFAAGFMCTLVIAALFWLIKSHKPAPPPEVIIAPPSTPAEINSELSYSAVHIEEHFQLPRFTFKEGHFLLGLLLCRKSECLIGLLAALLVELAGLGVIEMLDNDENLPLKNSTRVIYLVWACLLGGGVSITHATGFWSRGGRFRRITMMCGVGVCGLSTGIVGLAVQRLCAEQVRSWLIEFAVTSLLEMLVLEFLVASYRRLLL